MSLQNILISVAIIVMVTAGVFLVVAWAAVEANKHRRLALFERLRAGPWAVELRDAGRKRVAALRLVREGTGGGLRESKAMVDKTPSIILRGIARDDAEELVTRFEQIGAEAVVLPAAEVPIDEAYDLA
ncbi:MAG: ribosomal protein L7/L12 [Ardenticatenaceae bacterium]|nr:ribosomal protein L7/L12 [Ardenticatenaceae bacterium]